MEHLPYKNLVGILVGNIMPHANTLIIGLFSEPGDEHTVRVCVAENGKDSYEHAKDLIVQFKPVVRNVWLNGNVPNWYYLQLDLGHSPSELYGWALPYQALGLWADAVADAQGLVGLSISPQEDAECFA